MVIDLVKRCHKHSTIDVLTARGVLYSRGESYDENRFYSDPGQWPRLAEAHRREFLVRTDRGVFSLQAEAEVVRGAASSLEIAGGDRWQVTLEAGGAMAADGVVITGAGPAITVPGQPHDHPRVLDGRSYWLAAHELRRDRAVAV